MHSFIIIGDDIYTLDTAAERELAAAHMRDAGINRCSVFRGGPDGNEAPEGRDFGSDSSFHNDGMVGHSMKGCYGGPCGLVS